MFTLFTELLLSATPFQQISSADEAIPLWEEEV